MVKMGLLNKFGAPFDDLLMTVCAHVWWPNFCFSELNA